MATTRSTPVGTTPCRPDSRWPLGIPASSRHGRPSQGQRARDVTAYLAADLDPKLATIIAAAARHEPATGPGTEEDGHALTGPVFVVGAEPGDTLVVEIVDVRPADWGWTTCGPGVGLLGDAFEEWTLHVWDLRSGTTAVFAPGITVPMAPFCGVMGVAPGKPGHHDLTPPRRAGGNMDVRQLTAGATLALPVLVPGASFRWATPMPPKGMARWPGRVSRRTPP
ncbi:MAG TPA: acetamidase/formamidase family protein [Thermomicrobiales bacterium]|nr:acetamidase/formamidase family protein [Thermomicrobiales bacterium]